MRAAAFLCVCAVLLSTGCASNYRSLPSLEQQRWEALCCRMPKRRPPALSDAPPPPELTRVQRLHLEEAADRVLDSVVTVRVRAGARGARTGGPDVCETSIRSGGAGVVISGEGLILTNEHVIREAEEVIVVSTRGVEYEVLAIAIDPRFDLAVLRIARKDLPPLALSPLVPRLRAPVVAVSALTGREEQSLRYGVITGTKHTLQRELDPSKERVYSELIESTAKLEPGFSGGPLLDSTGRFVGLNVAASGCSGTSRQRGYAIPFNARTRQAVARLIARAE